jgi:acetyl esterase/lipase
VITRLVRAAAVAAAFFGFSLAQAAPPPLPSWVAGSWTLAEQRVSQVYLAALGRAPDPEGLNYWVFEVGGPSASPSMQQIYQTIETRMNGARSLVAPMVEDNATLVRYVYAFVLGKAYEDDPSGVDWWTQQLNAGTYTRGSFVETLFQAAAGTTEPRSQAIFQNRMAALEAVVKAQRMSGSRALALQDMLSLIRRVGDTLDSYNQAMADLYTLTRTTTARPVGPVFDQSYSASSLWSSAWAYPGGNGARVHRTVVWYNRSGDMMVANAYFPPTYGTGSNFSAIISLHGGAWRNGFVEQINQHNIEFAKDFVVFSPAYRLTALGYRAPAQQNDVLDFAQLIRSKASTFKLNGGRIHLWGFSAGGHLAMTAGERASQGCVAAASAPVDLRDAQNTPLLTEYINYYVGGAETKDTQSPRLQLGSSTTTSKFFLMYGSSDSLVKPAQYSDWTANVHPRVRVRSFAGEDHMLAGVLGSVYSETRNFFNTTCYQPW